MSAAPHGAQPVPPQEPVPEGAVSAAAAAAAAAAPMNALAEAAARVARRAEEPPGGADFLPVVPPAALVAAAAAAAAAAASRAAAGGPQVVPGGAPVILPFVPTLASFQASAAAAAAGAAGDAAAAAGAAPAAGVGAAAAAVPAAAPAAPVLHETFAAEAEFVAAATTFAEAQGSIVNVTRDRTRRRTRIRCARFGKSEKVALAARYLPPGVQHDLHGRKRESRKCNCKFELLARWTTDDMDGPCQVTRARTVHNHGLGEEERAIGQRAAGVELDFATLRRFAPLLNLPRPGARDVRLAFVRLGLEAPRKTDSQFCHNLLKRLRHARVRRCRRRCCCSCFWSCCCRATASFTFPVSRFPVLVSSMWHFLCLFEWPVALCCHLSLRRNCSLVAFLLSFLHRNEPQLFPLSAFRALPAQRRAEH